MWLQLCFALLLVTGGCGVTSISVPVDRPAEIFLRKYQSVLFHTNTHPDAGRHDFRGEAVASMIETEMYARFPSGEGLHVIGASQLAQPPSTTTDLTVAQYPELISVAGAGCLLQWHILECRYDEGIQSAEVRQADAETSMKNVRKGILRIRALVTATDMQERARFWEDTLEAIASAQSKASKSEPDDVDSLALLRTASGLLVGDIVRRATPRRERVAVSFLTDSKYPDLVKGIRAAERGDWSGAVDLFSSVARQAAGTDAEHRMLHNLGMAQLYRGDFRAAYGTFEAALRLKEDKRYEHALRQVLDVERESQEREHQRRP